MEFLRLSLPGTAHLLKCLVHGAGAVHHGAYIGGELFGKLALERHKCAQGLGAAEQTAIHLLLQHAAALGKGFHVGVQLREEVLESPRGLDSGGVKLDAHLSGHLGGLAAGLHQCGEDGGQLCGHLRGVTAHTRKRGEGGHKLIDAHAQCGGVTCHAGEGVGQLLKGGHAVLGRQLYLVLDVGGGTPLQTIVLDERGRHAHNLVDVCQATHGGACRYLQEGQPVVLGDTVGDGLIKAVGQLVAGDGYLLGQLGHLALELFKARGVFARHGVGLTHCLVELPALGGNGAQLAAKLPHGVADTLQTLHTGAPVYQRLL